MNRAIPAEVAGRLQIPTEVAVENDERLRGRLARILIRGAIMLANDAGPDFPMEVFAHNDVFQSATHAVLERLATDGPCVIIGRAAAVVLCDREDALHVRLDGPVAGRLRNAMSALKLSKEAAERQLQETDRARRAYVRYFYGRNWADPTLYHLQLDSTALPISACAHIIIEAARRKGITPA